MLRFLSHQTARTRNISACILPATSSKTGSLYLQQTEKEFAAGAGVLLASEFKVIGAQIQPHKLFPESNLQ